MVIVSFNFCRAGNILVLRLMNWLSMARSEVDWEFSSSELSAFWYAYLCHAFWFDLSAPHNPTLHRPRNNFPCASCAQKHSQTRPGTKFRSQGTCRTSVAHTRSGDQRQAVIKCCISEELIWKLIFQLAGKIRGWTAKPCFTLGLECLYHTGNPTKSVRLHSVRIYIPVGTF